MRASNDLLRVIVASGGAWSLAMSAIFASRARYGESIMALVVGRCGLCLGLAIFADGPAEN
jgi:hypothetical protein